jgi:hypothetical protein
MRDSAELPSRGKQRDRTGTARTMLAHQPAAQDMVAAGAAPAIEEVQVERRCPALATTWRQLAACQDVVTRGTYNSVVCSMV